MTICHRLTSFLAKSLFQLVPVFSGGLRIRLLGEHLHDVHHGEPPGFGLLVVDAADGLILELRGQVLHGYSSKLQSRYFQVVTICHQLTAFSSQSPYSWPVKAWCSSDFFNASSVGRESGNFQ